MTTTGNGRQEQDGFGDFLDLANAHPLDQSQGDEGYGQQLGGFQDLTSPNNMWDTPASAFWEEMSAYEEDIFTPLVSPAITGLTDASGMEPEGFQNGRFPSTSHFSPLSSPALGTSTATDAGGKRSSKKDQDAAKPKSLRCIKQSPLMKSQRKKNVNSTIHSAQLASDSISPENLDEITMPPPRPRERAAPKSASSIEQSPSTDFSCSPATPASLMNMSQISIPADLASAGRKQSDLLLPGPMQDESIFQTNGLAGGLRMIPLAPTVDIPMAGESHNTTSVPLAPNSARRKTRGGSASASPALQPRTSPSIQPLLPSGPDSPTIRAMLASKSNYQSMLEGTHSDLGLSFPEHLSSGVTSKRASHKLAEQGRRNRINQALQEMASIFPSASTSGGSTPVTNPTGPNAASASGASKATTIEQAIEYIRDLQTKLSDTQEQLNSANQELAQLRGGDR